MDAIESEVRQMLLERCDLMGLLQYLRLDESFRLAPLNFMRLLNEIAGVSVTESIKIISMFGPEMLPIEQAVDIERQWIKIIDHNYSAGGHAE